MVKQSTKNNKQIELLGDFKFDKIGAPYNDSVPVYAMRAVPAAFGSLLIPVAYMIMSQLGFSQWTSALTGFLFIFGKSFIFFLFSLCRCLCLFSAFLFHR